MAPRSILFPHLKFLSEKDSKEHKEGFKNTVCMRGDKEELPFQVKPARWSALCGKSGAPCGSERGR